jgi:hypothetical protein
MGISIATLMKKKAALEAELAEHGKDALNDEFKVFFKAHPECVGLRWSQYTPYFNDGEECIFRVNEFYLKMTNTPEDEGDDGDGYEDTFAYGDNKARKESEPFKSAAKAVRQLERIDKDVFKIAFGDHVQVTATRDGFEVEEYEHE